MACVDGHGQLLGRCLLPVAVDWMPSGNALSCALVDRRQSGWRFLMSSRRIVALTLAEMNRKWNGEDERGMSGQKQQVNDAEEEK